MLPHVRAVVYRIEIRKFIYVLDGLLLKSQLWNKYIKKEREDHSIKQKVRTPQCIQHSTVYCVYIGVGFA